MKKNNLIILIIFLFTLGCSSFKENTFEKSMQERFDYAILLLEDDKYEKAKNQLQIIIENDKGSSISLESYFLIGEAFYYLKNYDEAIYNYNYFSTFSNDIDKVEKAQFMKSKCNYDLSLNYKNDQTQTLLAISSIQEFLDNFPNSPFSNESKIMINELRNKLAKKFYENGRLYLKIKKYESAIFYFNIVINDYYDTKYSDESKISIIFAHILSGSIDNAKKYFLDIKDSFDSQIKYDEASSILKDYNNGIGIKGYYRLYK